MIRKLRSAFSTLAVVLTMAAGFLIFSAPKVRAQSESNSHAIKPLRSDVGINGLTANFHGLNDFHFQQKDTLESDGSSELEFVFHDVRMLSPRLGAGFKVLTSFFVNDAKGQPGFGIGSWGLGPLLRAYPLKTTRLQPYFQASALFGNNMAVGELANSKEGGNGFRVRLGLRGGVSYRLTNGLGVFIDGGPDWESSALFKADAYTWQLNFGIDVYRFN